MSSYVMIGGSGLRFDWGQFVALKAGVCRLFDIHDSQLYIEEY